MGGQLLSARSEAFCLVKNDTCIVTRRLKRASHDKLKQVRSRQGEQDQKHKLGEYSEQEAGVNGG